MNKTIVKMNKPVYLDLSMLDTSKILMYEYWNDYLKQKYGNNVKLCCMDVDSFTVYVKTKDIYANHTEDV